MSQNPLNAKGLEAAYAAYEATGISYDAMGITAAIHAYLASQEAAAPSEEPAAWQYRYRMWNTGDWSAWSVPTLDKSDSNDEWEWRPLFASPAVAPVAVSVKPFVPSERLEQLIGTQAASEAETHDMAVELILHRRGALSSIIPDPFGLSGEQIETLRSNGLKPEEIAGDQRTQARRVSELLHWFVRLARDSANPKWTRSHAFELAYYLATTDDRAPFDISAVERAAWLRGLQEPAAVRDMAVRHGWIPALSSITPATKGGEDAIRRAAIEDVLGLLTGHELYRYRPKAFNGFIEYARTELAALSAQDTDGVARSRDYSDYGVDADDPESAIAATIDNGEQAARIMRALADLGYEIVRKTSQIVELKP